MLSFAECEGGPCNPVAVLLFPTPSRASSATVLTERRLAPPQRAVADRLLGLSALVGDYAAWDRAHPAVPSSHPAGVGSAACLPSERELHPHASLDLSHAA